MPRPQVRTDHAACRERKILVFGQDLTPAVGALEELRAEPQIIQQAHLIIAGHEPRVRARGQAGQRIGQQPKDGCVLAPIVISEAVQQFDNVRRLTGEHQVLAQR